MAGFMMQANMIDYIDNGLTVRCVANEEFPIDRQTIRSERVDTPILNHFAPGSCIEGYDTALGGPMILTG